MNQIHFIAIGGAIMNQLAIALQRHGYIVTGSDDEIIDPAKTNLQYAGLLPEKLGWYPDKINSSLAAIVLGMHAKSDNPELLKAIELGIKVVSFPEYIYEISKNKKRIVVAGSHGKTTITSMIMHILKMQNLEFDYVVGAKVQGFEQSVKLSDAPLIIIEGDEYPASVIEKKPKIFFYHPHITVLSGIAWDHINVFPTYENYFSQFIHYLTDLDSGTTVFYNSEDNEVNRAIELAANKLNTVAYSTPEYYYQNGFPVITCESIEYKLSVFGKHNILNIQAAIDVCMQLGISKKDCYKAIATFTGAARRLEKILEINGIVAYRDFAHAPSKLKATLNAVREAYLHYVLIACFELHTYSSLNAAFLSEYANSLDAADIPIVYFSKHALTLKGLPEISTQTVYNYFNRKDLKVIDNKENLIEEIRSKLENLKQPVFLLLMSSGSFDGIDWNDVCSHSIL